MEIGDIQKTAMGKSMIGKGVFVVVFFLMVVWGVWHFSIGIRQSILSGNATTTVKTKEKAVPKTAGISHYSRFIMLAGPRVMEETAPEKEYIEIDIGHGNLSNVDATRWTLKNSQGETAMLGPISTLPLLGKVNFVVPLKIKSRDHLVISTGRSPIGVSFQLNACSAYLEQFQDFTPPIEKNCPSRFRGSEFRSLDESCQNFLEGLRECETNTDPIPASFSAACKALLGRVANYNGCVAIHKNDYNFYRNEWRIFLGKEKKMWVSPHGTITLSDENGDVINAIRY